MKIKKIIITIIVLALTGIYLFHWNGCVIDSKFFFSPLDVKLRILFDIRSDQHVPYTIARMLHNKITQGSMDIFNTYIHFWDIRFLFMLLSPFTLSGLLIWLYFVIRDKLHISIAEKTLIFFCLVLPMPILFGLMKNEVLALVILSLPLMLLSLRGFFLFLQKISYAWIVIVALIIFSLWNLSIMSTTLVDFCHV